MCLPASRLEEKEEEEKEEEEDEEEEEVVTGHLLSITLEGSACTQLLCVWGIRLE